MEEAVKYETKQDKTLHEIVIKIDPKPYVRVNAKSRHTKRAQKYHSWKREMQWLWKKAMLDNDLSPNQVLPGKIEHISFGIPIPNPKAGSKKEQQARLDRVGKPHTYKPDLDNLYKAFTDAVFYKAEVDDYSIHTVSGPLKKVWAPYEYGYISVSFYL